MRAIQVVDFIAKPYWFRLRGATEKFCPDTVQLQSCVEIVSSVPLPLRPFFQADVRCKYASGILTPLMTEGLKILICGLYGGFCRVCRVGIIWRTYTGWGFMIEYFVESNANWFLYTLIGVSTWSK